MTQHIKVMHAFAVIANQTIACKELDFNKWNKDNDAQTKAGKPAKGITSAYLKVELNKTGKAARKIFGPGPITLLHDKASPMQGLMKNKDLPKMFDGGVFMAAGKAPDMSQLDAGVCPFMEREVEGYMRPDRARDSQSSPTQPGRR
uniref:Uncharacterized protein n=1 Tax=Coccolithus braarudii TaxID=221442 RepID=A0A7S0LJ65_9EUKA|mmetsp:Transcript_39078/g.83300  ORF Transcript_39078/g.83300 Transcript_39078/m.83300 type:complete len:146 (+) Transcript_39078:3-440(+)